jgi:hypothetical protein
MYGKNFQFYYIYIYMWLLLLFLVFILSLALYYLRDVESFSQGPHDKKANIEPYVDVIYYINLDHRTDRNEEFLKEMDKLQFPREKIIRISGVYLKDRGHLGCSKSHILVMEDFIASNYRNCIVFEDDFEFTQPSNVIEDLFSNVHEIPYDVCLLAGNEQVLKDTRYSFVKKVVSCLTTSGYMVNRQFAPVLLQNFKEGAEQLERSYNEGPYYRGEFAVDQYWIQLQPLSNWYIFEPKLGKQRKSFSDIGNGLADYKV